MYIEGFVEEELLTFEAPNKSIDPVNASDADLRAMGLRVINGGR
jgi:hypothetical protein